jgi:hypothetical protein
MLQTKKTEKAAVLEDGGLENLCCNLFDEWFFGLGREEKEVWLWNSMVEMAKIKKRRTRSK